MTDATTHILVSDMNSEQEDQKSNIGMIVGFSGVKDGRWLKVSASLNYELPMPILDGDFDEAKKKLDELYDFLEASVLEKYIIFCESSEVVNEL